MFNKGFCALLLVMSGLSLQVRASNYATWSTCITVANSYCTLDPGSYTVSSTLYPADGVTMIGGGVGSGSTTLVRPSNTTSWLIFVYPGRSVTIELMTIDGNRYSFPNATSGCDSTGTYPCGPSGGYGCTAANYGAALDIQVDGTALINNMQFWNSAGTAALYMKAGTVESTSFYYSRSNGAEIYSGGTVHDSQFLHNGTSGLGIAGTGSSVYNNYFYMNRSEMPDGSGGGQLNINPSASNSSVIGNYIDGNGWTTPPVTGAFPPPSSSYINGCYPPWISSPQSVYGMEVEPSSSNSTVWGNEITGNPGSGITANDVTSLSLSGYSDGSSSNPKYIHDNLGTNPPFGNYTNGIEILNSSSGITLTGILSRNNDGYSVTFNNNGISGTGWQNNHCLSSNHYSPSYVTSTGLTNATPSSTATCP